MEKRLEKKRREIIMRIKNRRKKGNRKRNEKNREGT